jgi:hypothetical protein
MDLTEASKMMVVAWVKDWSIVTLLCYLDKGENRWVDETRVSAAHARWPFMPACIDFYIMKTPVKTFLAETARPISDRLFDAKGPQQLLAVAPHIARHVSLGTRIQGSVTWAERNEIKRTRRENAAVTVGRNAATKQYKRGLRGAWNVCKA